MEGKSDVEKKASGKNTSDAWEGKYDTEKALAQNACHRIQGPFPELREDTSGYILLTDNDVNCERNVN